MMNLGPANIPPINMSSSMSSETGPTTYEIPYWDMIESQAQ